MDQEHRNRNRVHLDKMVFVKSGATAHAGLLKDISSGGAAMELVNPTGKVENPFVKNDSVDIEIDGIDSLRGKVVRVAEAEVAVAFEVGIVEEDRLIAEIMSEVNQIAPDN